MCKSSLAVLGCVFFMLAFVSPVGLAGQSANGGPPFYLIADLLDKMKTSDASPPPVKPKSFLTSLSFMSISFSAPSTTG